MAGLQPTARSSDECIQSDMNRSLCDSCGGSVLAGLFLGTDEVAMRFARRGDDESDSSSEPHLLTRPAPPEPATFDGAKIVEDYLVQDWTTAYGTVGWAHPLKATSPPVEWLSSAVYSQSWEHMQEWYSAFVMVEAALNLDLAPQLHAMDVLSGNRRSDVYKVTCIEAPAKALLELAADEPAGSPAAAVCLWLARHLRCLAAKSAQDSIEEVRTEGARPDSDCAYVLHEGADEPPG